MPQSAPRVFVLNDLSKWPFYPSSTVKDPSRTLDIATGWCHLLRLRYTWLSVR
jgi:hypothetical protein